MVMRNGVERVGKVDLMNCLLLNEVKGYKENYEDK